MENPETLEKQSIDDQCSAYYRPAGPERGYSRTELVDKAREGKL